MQLFEKSALNLLSHVSASIVSHLFSSLQNYWNDNWNFPFVFDGKTWNNTPKIAYAYDNNVSFCPWSIIFNKSLLAKSMLLLLLLLKKFYWQCSQSFTAEKNEVDERENTSALFIKTREGQKFSTLSYAI